MYSKPIRIVLAWPFSCVMAVALRGLADRLLANRRVGTRVPQTWSTKVLEVEPNLWRGPAPTGAEAYRELSAAGARTVVDLRSEVETDSIRGEASSSGLTVAHISIDNARAPTLADLERFEGVLAEAPTPVYVHCEAGEGRTGSIIGAHQVRGGCRRAVVIADSLAVGSMAFSQLLFVVSVGAIAPLVAVTEWILDRPTDALFGFKPPGPDRSNGKQMS